MTAKLASKATTLPIAFDLWNSLASVIINQGMVFYLTQRLR
jgi:hypothetical protein